MARPTKNNPTGAQKKLKLTDDVVNKLEASFAIGASITEACFYADISRETYYNWVEENKELFDKFERLRAKPILEARQQVIDKIKAGDADLALKFLERVKKDEFSLRTEHTGKDGKPIEVLDVDIDDLDDETYEQIVNREKERLTNKKKRAK